jgi:hypothetical protein
MKNGVMIEMGRRANKIGGYGNVMNGMKAMTNGSKMALYWSGFDFWRD